MAKKTTTTKTQDMVKTRVSFKDVIAYNALPADAKFDKIVQDKEVIIGSYKYALDDNFLDWIYDKWTKINGEKVGFETQGMITFDHSKLLQSVSSNMGIDDKGEEGLPGMLVLKGRATKTLNAIPIFNYKTRSKFEKDAMSPSCGSPNGVFSFNGKMCASCLDKDWVDGVPAACSESEVIVFYNPEEDVIFNHYFQKTSKKVGTELIKNLRSNSAIFEKRVELSSEKKTGNSRKYYVMDFSVLDEVSPENMIKSYMLSFLIKNWREKKLSVAQVSASSRLYQNTGEDLNAKIKDLKDFTRGSTQKRLPQSKTVDSVADDIIAEDDSDTSSVFDLE